MRFEVRYPGGKSHEVELHGPLAVLGRDPSCDLVLSDDRCSRRHAVVEIGPDGLVIRDAGSANGLFVNGRKMERSPLVEGDLVRVGEVILKVLPKEIPGTVVMAPEDLVELGPGPGSPPKPMGPSVLGTAAGPLLQKTEPVTVPPPSSKAASSPTPGAVAPKSGDTVPREPIRSPRPEAGSSPSLKPRDPTLPRRPPRPAAGPARPQTVTVLSLLWMASVLLYGAGGFVVAFAGNMAGLPGGLAIGGGLLLALLSGILAFGLWTLAPWARSVQIGIAGLGLVLCPFTLASATVLIYALRPGTRAAFDGREPTASEAAAESTFAITLLGTVLLGAALCAVGGLLSRFARS
jgi:hypothetical protein